MAQKVSVQFVDDLDGTASDEVETVSFALDGVNYEIDLGPGNAGQLREVLGTFVGAARRTGGRVKRGLGTTTPAPNNREQTRAIRDWARQQGHDLSDRGRIPASIVEAFETAHTQPQPSQRRGRRKKAS